MTKKEQILNIYDWVQEWRDEVMIFEYDNGNEYKVILSYATSEFSFVVRRKWEFICHFYDITFINNICSDYYYAGHNILVKKIFKFVKKLYEMKYESDEKPDIFEEAVNKMINFEPYDDFDFGEPMHRENLPECELEIGKSYLVPMTLIDKERRFDGGRGTEIYEFAYKNCNPLTKHIFISDKYMSKEISSLND